MRILINIFPLLPLLTTGVVADHLTPRFIPPKDLTSETSKVAQAWTEVVSSLTQILQSEPPPPKGPTDPLPGVHTTTFSLGMFSLHDPGATTLQFHYTSPEIENAVNGTHKVDADSIYRVASITKVFTVLAGLIELSDADWLRPITDVFPDLLGDLGVDPSYTERTQWDKVTLEALSAHMGGVSKGGIPYDTDLLPQYLIALLTNTLTPETDAVAMGLPPLTLEDPSLPPCLRDGTFVCDKDDYGIARQVTPPITDPWVSPAYSNNGFIMLGTAITNLTGKSFESLYQDSILSPLSMASTSSVPPESTVPNFQRSVIPGTVETAGWVGDFGITVGSGGIFSTLNDLAKFGLGILGNKLLSTEQTNKWLKPVTHTANLEFTVGRPWEIARFTLPGTTNIVDLYTKSGDSGFFSSFLVLLPQYDCGFTVLTAATDVRRSFVAAFLGDMITKTVIPALEAQAIAETAQNLVGTYVSSDENLDSSVVLALNESTIGGPDVVIESWKSNGTDMLPVASAFLGSGPLRLLPSIIRPGETKAAFRVTTLRDPPEEAADMGPFLKQYAVNIDWLAVDVGTYGGISFGLFLADLDDEGKVTALSPAVTRAWLNRKPGKKC